jgi:glucose/arabinose dehydrogenase
MFPAELHGNLFIAYHGSWNRKQPTGYKVVRVFSEPASDTIKLIGTEDFITGWLTRSGDVLGRPVDIINWIDGSLLISDDKAGVIYRVWYDG